MIVTVKMPMIHAIILFLVLFISIGLWQHERHKRVLLEFDLKNAETRINLLKQQLNTANACFKAKAP